jgi:DNA helicase-2/ATP-dependent DNA helicase PcrA
VPDADILSLTFTREAAAEMGGRSESEDAKKIFRTFHSFIYELVQRERSSVPFPLSPAIVPTLEEYELRDKLVRLYPLVKKSDDLKKYISSQKRLGITPDQAIEREIGMGQSFAHAYQDYERRCREEGWLDFDSLVVVGTELLENHSDIRARYAKKYIQVDEAQDSSPSEIKILKLLFTGNIFLVGDSNQSIYGFRGASPDIMASLPQIFSGAKIFYLGTNYRSTGALVEFFREILPVDNGLASHMRTSNAAGEGPTFTHYVDDYQEAQQVLRRVIDPPNTAIIARTNRQIFRYQQACFNAGIKSKILGKKAFWEQNEVKQLLSLAKATKFPAEYTAPMVLKALVIQHRLLEKYKFSGNPLDSDPADNINSLYKMSAKYATIKEFLDFIRRLTYGSKAANTPCLTLSTAHQAKGREWKHVFLVGVTEGILPHQKAEHPEEHRIFFVGASRAAERLHITCYKNPSMFLNKYVDKIVKYVPEVAAVTA